MGGAVATGDIQGALGAAASGAAGFAANEDQAAMISGIGGSVSGVAGGAIAGDPTAAL